LNISIHSGDICIQSWKRFCTTFSDFGYCYPFWRYSRSKWEGVRNWAKLSMLFAPNFFWEWTSKFLDQHL